MVLIGKDRTAIEDYGCADCDRDCGEGFGGCEVVCLGTMMRCSLWGICQFGEALRVEGGREMRS
ncbi:hypothetical protein Sjap_019666 [Stephania japonica]|uniref:Uncharacterized protein n=1 Tax=Stephania japonica TaxID=461633 RepID=A0AAP0F215_9MAGN